MMQIQLAVERAPQDIFVQRTAGQMLAWYDTATPQPQLPDVVKQGIPNIFDSLSGCRAVTSATSSSQVMPTTYPARRTATIARGSVPPSMGGSCWSKSGFCPRR